MMAGSSFGRNLRITTFGESHGRAVGVIIDGVKPGLKISEAEIQHELDKRRPGQSGITSPRREADRVEIISGIFKGKTLGTPICLLVWNKDQDPAAYRPIKNLFRPGHAGFTYLAKYGIEDHRGGGRSSGRETVGRVAGGALAKKLLASRGICITAYTVQVGGLNARKFDLSEIEKNPLRCPDRSAAKKMERAIKKAMLEGDSLGGIVEVLVKNPPAGLGEPVFDKLEADLAKAMMSIPAVRGFEVGSGFGAARMKGSEHNDEFYRDSKTGRIRTKTNNAGGIIGGISSGEDIIFRIAVKPTSSIRRPQQTVDARGRRHAIRVAGRHDPCICPRLVPVAEAMAALVIADHLTRQHRTNKKSLGAALKKETVLMKQLEALTRRIDQ
jgi:chorismate synthase